MRDPCCSFCREIVQDTTFYKFDPQFNVTSFTSLAQINQVTLDSDLFSIASGSAGVTVSGNQVHLTRTSASANSFFRGRYSTRDNDDVASNAMEYLANIRIKRPFGVTVHTGTLLDNYDPYIIAPGINVTHPNCFSISVSSATCLDTPVSQAGINFYGSRMNIASISFARSSSTELYVSFGQRAANIPIHGDGGFRTIQKKIDCDACDTGTDGNNRHCYGILSINENDFFDVKMVINPIVLNNGNDYFDTEYYIDDVLKFTGRYYATVPPAGVGKRHFMNRCAWNYFIRSQGNYALDLYNNFDIASISANII